MIDSDNTLEPLTPEASDAALVEAFLYGDETAIRKISDWVARIVRLRAWRLRRHDDIVQDVLVELITVLGAGRFAGRSSLQTFVERVAKYRCIDTIRRERIRQHVSLEENREPEPTSNDNPEQRLATRDEIRLCYAVLQRLPATCRELLRRVLADEVRYEELAVEQGVALGTIKSRVARCRERANTLRHHMVHTPGAWREGGVG